MKRRLRIAMSVFFGTLCLAFAVLWFWSYHSYLMVAFPVGSGRFFQGESILGQTVAGVFNGTSTGAEVMYLSGKNFDSKEWEDICGEPFALSVGMKTGLLRLPHWFMVCLSAALAIIPCAHWRFSLRTLLIATTLVAVLLGLVCYTVR